MNIIKTCSCKKEYTLEEWDKLPFVGFFDLDEDGDQKGELRNCSCKSSISIDKTIRETVSHAPTGT